MTLIPNLVFHHHTSLGDHYICNGIAHNYAKKCETLHIPCSEGNYETVNSLYSDCMFDKNMKPSSRYRELNIPGLFETQNKLAGTEFDPTTAGEDTSFNQQVNSVYASQSNQSSNEQTSADNLTPPPPGTPSKETMERLRAAVSKSPNNQTLTSKPMVATKNPEIKDKPRFGIGSLINRMAGTGQAEPPQNDIPKAQKDNGQNNYNAENEELDSNKEKIEVPAFLRRQAN